MGAKISPLLLIDSGLKDVALAVGSVLLMSNFKP